jgi:hypothetical protein
VSINPLGNTLQRVVRSGPRWRATVEYPTLAGQDARLMAAFMDQASRGDRWIFLPVPQAETAGNWSINNLITNGDLSDESISGWTAGYSGSLSNNARRLKVSNGSTGSPTEDGAALQNVTMEAGKPHILLASAFPGNGEAVSATIDRQSDQVDEATTTNMTAPNLIALSVTPTVAAMRVNLYNRSQLTEGYVYFGNVSLARCLLVNGSQQIGNKLRVDGGPTSASSPTLGVNAALKAGEFVCFRGGNQYELKRLTSDFDTDTTGAGYLEFEPFIRTAPSDNEPVIVYKPFVRMILAQHTSAHAIDTAKHYGFVLELVEDVTP